MGLDKIEIYQFKYLKNYILYLYVSDHNFNLYFKHKNLFVFILTELSLQSEDGLNLGTV